MFNNKISIMVKGSTVSEKKLGFFLWTNGFCLVDEATVWFVPAEYNCLIQYDITSGTIIRNILLRGSSCLKGTHYNLLKHRNYIILIPTRDMNVFIYDIDNNKLHRLPLIGECNRQEKYITYSTWEDYIYCFPLNREEILRIDISNMSIKFIKWDRASEYLSENMDYVEYSVSIGSKVFMLISQSNIICEYDMESERDYFFCVGEEQAVYTNICQYGDNGLILVEKSGDIFILDSDKKIVGRKKGLGKGDFVQCVIWDDGYMLFDRESKMLYWDEKTECEFTLDIERKNIVQKWDYLPFSRISIGTKYAVFFNIPLKTLLVINKKNFESKEYNITTNQLSDGFVDDIYMSAYEVGNGILQEDSTIVISLERFINIIKMSKDYGKGVSYAEYLE